MQEESPRRPANRRRIGVNYILEETSTSNALELTTIVPVEELDAKREKVKVRDPFTALKEEDEKLKKIKVESTTIPLKVKEVLKETTEKRVSLSELLQRKNLTLSELLKGDPAVLLALTENSQETSNNINRNFESTEKTDPPIVDLQKITTEPTKTNLFLVRRKEIVTNRMSLKPKLRLAKPREPEKNESVVANGPVRVTIDLDSAEELPEKLKNVTAKEELMEILRDPIGSERLARILEMRNMTLEELIQQRERGASNLHLSDIFHSEKREPVPKEKPLIGKIVVFPTVKVVPLQPPKGRALEFPEQKPAYTVTSFPTYKIEMEKPDQSHQFFPVDSFHENSGESSTYYSTDFAGIEDIQRIEDVENRIAEAVNEKLNVELIEETSSVTHSGVKSAIVASAIIVGASLSVFLTIFVVFKWTQKQKRRLNYCDSFTRIRAPILEMERNKRSIRTIMTETLGRKKPYYKQNLQQSMSDNVSWEGEKKPY